SRNGIYGTSRGIAYIRLMLAARITSPHFSVSAAICFPNSAGVLANTMAPRSASWLLDFRVGERGIDLPVELVDDFGRRVSRRANSLPAGRLVARHKFADGRDVGQRLRARRGGYCERAQPVSPDIFDRCGSVDEHDLHLPGKQINERGPRAAIVYLHQIDARHRFE